MQFFEEELIAFEWLILDWPSVLEMKLPLKNFCCGISTLTFYNVQVPSPPHPYPPCGVGLRGITCGILKIPEHYLFENVHLQ